MDRNKEGMLANFWIPGPPSVDDFLCFLVNFGANLEGVGTPGTTSAPPGRPGSIFHRFLVDFGCPWGALGAPLGTLFGPWALPGRPRRQKSREK